MASLERGLVESKTAKRQKGTGQLEPRRRKGRDQGKGEVKEKLRGEGKGGAQEVSRKEWK